MFNDISTVNMFFTHKDGVGAGLQSAPEISLFSQSRAQETVIL